MCVSLCSVVRYPQQEQQQQKQQQQQQQQPQKTAPISRQSSLSCALEWVL
jgi:hypothetical protein